MPTYSLTQSPTGMTIDAQGRVRWLSDMALTGQSFDVAITVQDAYGGVATEAYVIVLQPDHVAPEVTLAGSGSQVNIGDTLTFHVGAVDNVGVDTVALWVDGIQVALREVEGLHVANVPFATPGLVAVVATATDLAGNTFATAPWQVRVFDPLDNEHPVIAFEALIPQVWDAAQGIAVDGDRIEGEALLRSPSLTYVTDVEVSIFDDNLSDWRIEYAAANAVDVGELGADDPDYILLAEGTEIVDHRRFSFDPTLLANRRIRNACNCVRYERSRLGRTAHVWCLGRREIG